MLKKLLFPLLRIAFVGVASNGNKALVHTKYLLNNKLSKEESREFDLINGKPTQQMVDYLDKVDRSTSYYYLAVVLNSINQGAVPSTDEEFFIKLGIDTKNILTIQKNSEWTIYGSNYDVDEIQKNYEVVDGVDFIFPTESVVDFLRKDEFDSTEAYLLYCKSSATLTIYHKNILSYSSHFIFSDDEEIISSDDEDGGVADLLDDVLGGSDILEEIVELDNINDDFDTIEDLNDFVANEDSLDFDGSKDFGTIDSSSSPSDEYDFLEEESHGDLRKDMQLLEFVKSSINDFYKNDNLTGGFISKTTILDSQGDAKGVARFINEELYIETEIIDIDIAKTISDMAINEAKK